MLVDQLRHRDLAEIGITQEIRAVIHRPPEGLDRQMHRLRRTITEPREIKSFQNIEGLDQCNAARRWRWRRDDLVATIGSANRAAILYLVVRKIFRSYQAASLLDCGNKFLGQCTFVKRT